MRAQEKLDLSAKDASGKLVIKSLGWQPICEKRFPYEMTASFTLNPLTPGVVDMDLPHKIQDQHRMAFPADKHISVEAGTGAGSVGAGGHHRDARQTAVGPRPSSRTRRDESVTGILRGAFTSDERSKLKPIKQELLAAGNQADKNLAGDAFGPHITKDQSLDLEAMLAERGIEHVAFLGKLGVAGFHQIRAVDHQRAIDIIEEWV